MYRSTSNYGWKPDLPDQRDFKYLAAENTMATLPPMMDLRPDCPPVYDQGRLCSCTGNAIAAAFAFALKKENAPVFTPSRLFIYYNERSIENSIDSDSGAQIRDGMKSIGNLGVCNENDWPYNINEFTVKPFASCYDTALQHTAIGYQRVMQDLDQMKGCIADGFPIVVGFTVYQSFEGPDVKATGTLNLPAAGESMVGGHAVLVVGYDDASHRFTVRNSWGDQWGMQGYFTMPYEYLTDDNLASDFWTVRVTSIAPAAPKPGEQDQASTILREPNVSATPALPVTLNAQFKDGDSGNLQFILNRRDGTSMSDSIQVNDGKQDKDSITLTNAAAFDGLVISGFTSGTVSITLDRSTRPPIAGDYDKSFNDPVILQ